MNSTYIGVVDGLHTWVAQDETGAIVGTNQSAFPPRPDGDGWTLDEVNCVWVQGG